MSMSAIVWTIQEEHKTLLSIQRWLQMVRAVLSDGLLFTSPPPGLTVSTCKGQDQRPLSWCVFTRLADPERSAQLEKWGRGAQLPITNTLAVLLNPPKKSQKSRQIHHFCIWSLSPRCCLITESIAQSLFGTGEQGRPWLNCSCGSTSLLSPLARLPVVICFPIDWDCRPFQTLTTDQLEWDRGVLLWGYWLLFKFT